MFGYYQDIFELVYQTKSRKIKDIHFVSKVSQSKIGRSFENYTYLGIYIYIYISFKHFSYKDFTIGLFDKSQWRSQRFE